MTPFDPIKAAREELAGLLDVHKLTITRCRDAEQRHHEAEADRNQLMKLERFVGDLVEKQRAHVNHLEQEAEAKGSV